LKLAAIDIGSNAVRLLIEELVVINDGENFFRKISLTRVPIRLGEDVFGNGKITDEKAERLVKTIEAFKLLMQVNGVSHYRACATSAMREAKNGNAITKYIKDKVDVKIEIIDGFEEAELIFENFKHSKLSSNQAFLYIDVGGGSTEVSLIKNKVRVKSKSFKLGTVRLLQGKAPKTVWDDVEKWLKDLKIKEEVIAIGTGGNINRIFKESSHRVGEKITYSEIKSIVENISKHSYEERINKLNLKPDRADVIIPAGKIYLMIMKTANIVEMIVPKVGLADGVIFNLYKNNIENKA
jgi:exopolyphosphatase/guanosine-5'-triphosphate,3'-diphosphate pyrophosphatase